MWWKSENKESDKEMSLEKVYSLHREDQNRYRVVNSLQVSDTEHRTEASFKQYSERSSLGVICQVGSLPLSGV